MMKRAIYSLILVFVTICSSQAQIDPLFFQQTHVRGLFNPAATGKGGDIDVSLSVREQWIGFEGRPSTQALMVSGFASKIQSGFGVTCIVDAFGPQQTKNIKLNYAYYVSFEDEALLSLGLGMGVMHSTYRLGEHFFVGGGNGGDMPIPEIKNNTTPDFDVGIEFNTRNFEMGGAITHVTYSRYDRNLVRPIRNYYAYMRTKQPLNTAWDFIPGFTWQNVRKSNLLELNAGFRHNNNFCLNLIYRYPANGGMAVGFNIFNGFRLVYSYDQSFNNVGTYLKGTHEATVAYNIPMNTTYIQNRLRFFKWKMF